MISRRWIGQWLGALRPYLIQYWSISMTIQGVTRPQWVNTSRWKVTRWYYQGIFFNSLRPGYWIWRQKSHQHWARYKCTGLLPDGTSPSPKPVLAHRQCNSVTFTWEKFNRKCSRIQYARCVRKWNLRLPNEFKKIMKFIPIAVKSIVQFIARVNSLALIVQLISVLTMFLPISR